MTEGFVLDKTHGGVGVSSWVEGAPETSVWTGVKLTGRPQARIATWRCGRCGFLESYATGETDGSAAAQKKAAAAIIAVAVVLMLMLGLAAAYLAQRGH
jgi:hypothetical protein